MIVDSCVTEDKKTPAAFRYLSEIKCDPSRAVKLVVATHWHDDHIRGMAELYRGCSSASFVCSLALRNKDFLTLATAANRHCMSESSGVGEFLGVLQELEGRSGSPKWAAENRTLWARDGEVPCHIEALSPADPAVTRAFQSIGQMSHSGGVPKRRIPAPERNDGAVAIMLEVGATRILLGADLLDSSSPDQGWHAVIASPRRGAGRAKVYKVAHHGAASADSPQIWSDLLTDQPVAVLTPFVRGNRALPTNRDIKRLRQRTAHLYATSRSASDRMEFERGPVGRTKREVLRSSRKISTSTGHVRIRMDLDGAGGRVDLFGDAVALGTAPAGDPVGS